MTRPETVVPEEPTGVYPIIEKSQVISGFGRGSSELGIPTANIPINEALNKLEPGIYYGWCQLVPALERANSKTTRNDGNEVIFNHGKDLTSEELVPLPMVMSIGWNPFYQNKEKAAEVHIMHKFQNNFYGSGIKYNVLGYIRPELNYTTKGTYFSQFLLDFPFLLTPTEALIEDINLDIRIALDILAKESYKSYQTRLDI